MYPRLNSAISKGCAMPRRDMSPHAARYVDTGAISLKFQSAYRLLSPGQHKPDDQLKIVRWLIGGVISGQWPSNKR